MKRAILIHRQDFIAILALVVLAVAVVVYILDHQPSFTLGKSYYTVKAQFASGAAVTSGQGQSVDVAGVQVGQVGAVDLEDGRAVVTMNIYKKYKPIYRNATVLLRPRTPLKDMYLSLDPGTADCGRGPERRNAPGREHRARRQRRGDPGLARRRHAQLPAAAARRRGAVVPRRLRHRRGAQPQGGRRPARHVQAVRAAQPGHEDVHVAAGAADQEHPPLDPQPPGGLAGARRGRRHADLADQLLQPELRRDLLAGPEPRAGADAAARDACSRPPGRWARCRRSRTRARRR